MKGTDDGESFCSERKARRVRVAGTTGASRAAAIGAKGPPAPCQRRMQRGTSTMHSPPGNAGEVQRKRWHSSRLHEWSGLAFAALRQWAMDAAEIAAGAVAADGGHARCVLAATCDCL